MHGLSCLQGWLSGGHGGEGGEAGADWVSAAESEDPVQEGAGASPHQQHLGDGGVVWKKQERVNWNKSPFKEPATGL